VKERALLLLSSKGRDVAPRLVERGLKAVNDTALLLGAYVERFCTLRATSDAPRPNSSRGPLECVGSVAPILFRLGGAELSEGGWRLLNKKVENLALERSVAEGISAQMCEVDWWRAGWL
jgi:hypothetical protein